MSQRESDDGEKRLALLVLGMHRSGTSALTRVLSLCGADLPKRLIPPSQRNPLGFFESELIYRLHDEILADAGTSWQDLSPFPVGWLSTPAAQAWADRMAEAVCEEFDNSAFFVVKDPRLCRLVPFWLGVVERIGVEARFVIPIRDPLECASSLRESDEIPLASGFMLWLDYFLAAERGTREHARSFVTYPDLLANWRAVVRKIEKDLDVRFQRTTRATAAEVDEFLRPRLRRQLADPEEFFRSEDIHEWVKDAYRWVLGATQGKRRGGAALDRISAEFARAESAFGPAVAASALATERKRVEFRTLEEELEKAQKGLEEQKRSQAELQLEFAQQRRETRIETARVRESARMLMRWVVERVRGESHPAPASLRATLDALENAGSAEVPGLVSTGLVISDQRLEITRLERERASRANELARLATRLTRAEQGLAEKDQQLSALVRELGTRSAGSDASTSEEGAEEGDTRPARAETRGPLGCALVIDACIPTPVRDARSIRMLNLLRILREVGFNVTFLPESLAAPEPFMSDLESYGIRVLCAPGVNSLQAFLDQKGENFDLCLVSRPNAADRWLPSLRKACPGAKLIFDAADLMDGDALTARLGRGKKRRPQAAGEADGFLAAIEAGAPGADLLEREPCARALPGIYEVRDSEIRVEERRDLLFLNGFQEAPSADALLWLLDEILPEVKKRVPDLRVHLRDDAWTRGLTAHRAEVVLLTETEMAHPRALDVYRLAVAPARFGPELSGRVIPVLAEGLPCICSPLASRDLPAAVVAGVCVAETTEAFAEGIVELCSRSEPWYELSRRAREGVASVYGYERMRDSVRDFLGELGFATSGAGAAVVRRS